MDLAICDLVSILWIEACIIIGKTLDFLKLLKKELRKTKVTGKPKSTPTNRYLNTTEVTFESLRHRLGFAWKVFWRRFNLRDNVSDGVVDIRSNLYDYTTRPLPEVVMETILNSTKPKDLSHRNQIEE